MQQMRQKPQPTRIIGIDYGLARIGIAVSDESKTIATPLITLKTEKKTDLTAAKLLDELLKHQKTHHYTIETIVIGLPLMMSGKVGFLADEVKHFVELLKKLASYPIITWDERLTSVQADRSLREGNLSRRKRAQSIDIVAAVLILQSYLDHLKIQKQRSSGVVA